MAASCTGEEKVSCDFLLNLPLSLNSSYNLHHRCASAKEVVACFILFLHSCWQSCHCSTYSCKYTTSFLWPPFCRAPQFQSVFWDAAEPLFFDLNWWIKIQTRTKPQKYTCLHMPRNFFITRLYKTWKQPRLSRQKIKWWPWYFSVLHCHLGGPTAVWTLATICLTLHALLKKI